MISIKLFCCFLSLFVICEADIYVHNPRGSNNRLNEKTQNRRNANRLFDSQNNNKGGYNIGDKGPNGFTNYDEQYQMKYFASASKENPTVLTVEWTNQHGCGAKNKKVNCNLVLQYTCQNDKLRDGTTTNTQDYNAPGNQETKAQFEARKAGNVKDDRGYHEEYEWYDKCRKRDRNAGLFTADQRPGREAHRTRQNPGGTRRGYECPEERDYHPYWHPSPWIDIAVLANQKSDCATFQGKSFNVKPKHECIETFTGETKKRHYSKHNNENDCKNNGGTWTALHNYLEKDATKTNKASCESGGTHIWAVPSDGWKNDYKEECLLALKEPECKEAEFSRVNHHGNTYNLKMLSYDWHLPQLHHSKERKCVFRIRYNISTDDYDVTNVNASDNNREVEAKGLEPLIQNDPNVAIGDKFPLQLAINTAQFGRTFEDRSHVFKLVSRKQEDIDDDRNLFNLNVRGKRGNIVQAYPAVEYDFFPTTLEVSEDDMIHIQWTGSNTHNNGGGGDGQAGDAGEGKGGSDRQNILGLFDLNTNFPGDMDDKRSIFSKDAIKEIIYVAEGDASKFKAKDIAIQMATSGFFKCEKKDTCGEESLEEKDEELNNTLDNANASYGGAILRFNPGTYYYMCTRNNNFTNRSQKGTLIVKKSGAKK